jgi:hypothetical protein
MTVKVGNIASVKLGTYLIAEMGTFSISGFSREALDISAFGDTTKKFTFGSADGGEISFSGNYDPTDTSGQLLIDSACVNASVFTGQNLKFYIDSTSYFTVDTGGNILITKCRGVTFDKSGVGTIEFTGKVSAKPMVLC